EGHLRQGGREGGNQHGGDGAGEERSQRRYGEGRPCAALARHFVAVEAGYDGGGFARYVDKDRGGGAAVLRPVVDPGDHDQARHRRQGVGERQQHGDGGQRPQSRQDADGGTDQDADEAEREIGQ